MNECLVSHWSSPLPKDVDKMSLEVKKNEMQAKKERQKWVQKKFLVTISFSLSRSTLWTTGLENFLFSISKDIFSFQKDKKKCVGIVTRNCIYTKTHKTKSKQCLNVLSIPHSNFNYDSHSVVEIRKHHSINLKLWDRGSFCFSSTVLLPHDIKDRLWISGWTSLDELPGYEDRVPANSYRKFYEYLIWSTSQKWSLHWDKTLQNFIGFTSPIG